MSIQTAQRPQDTQPAAQVQGTFTFPRDMKVCDLKHPVRAAWLKRKPIGNWG
ncbi:hypothetical protein NJC40_03675 [Pseudomonas sp. 21LCFQ02]|uniref:hypothetical protein n=1 Tax=Pseudomonas sp. 21LCFQ02 TaxID=2957505 RepID=UPI00209AB43D|nr:hypothetical protein [Pseudomonas sp. 21LCFQ02]MCO8166878.1 hypothetical protein [Pseudomonas sp. 21LCFQ02]